ncbi:redoxin domain-containing protein [Calothrix rhizosoleniae]|uniref:redoxin domain-containing protein n=1 Tax=Calothrix rhizosoleniae TaxID=888997 RepID=UPI000B49FDFD|nr:redoxin domain-containing protein [Calothrix rhizosoleniae]
MSSNFTVKVFFRGDWCPWCSGYLKDFNDKALHKIQELGGNIVGITSQAGNQSQKNLGLNFDIQIDEENIEAKKYGIFITPKAETPLKDVDGVYPNGMAQPGVVIEDSKGKILYKWAIVPSEMNLGGASDRPLVADIVASLEQILKGQETGDSFSTTSMSYLEQNHPEEYQKVQAYIASLNK